MYRHKSGLDKIIVLWTANTERFCTESVGLHDTADNLVNAIKKNESEISPSTLFAVASILEGVRLIIHVHVLIIETFFITYASVP